MERIVPRLAQRAEQASLNLSLTISESDAKVNWSVDVTSLEQILLNLTDNAAKYAPGRKEAPLALELVAAISGKSVQLRLADHGPGITKQASKRIFTPFHKSAAEAAHSAPGVGLGLSLSRRLARQMGGELRFEPGKAAGAVFVLTLPFVAEV